MRAWVIITALLALTTMSPATAADGIPDSATLEARMDQARGPVPNAYRQVITYRGTSSSGTQTTFVRGNDEREIDNDGTFTTQSGTYKGDAWHQNENGHTVIEQPDPGEATTEATTTTVARVSTPVDAYVIATLTANGYGSKEYVDPQTFYVLRYESIRPSGTTTTVYGPRKTFGARHLAESWHVHDESTKIDTDYTLTEYAAGGITDDDVAVPDNRRTLVQFPAGQTTVTLPSKFSRDGHVYVRLDVGGRGLDFTLDSGSYSIAINGDIARQLGLTVKNAAENNVNAGGFKTGDVIVPHVKVGSLAMDDVVMSIAPEDDDDPHASVRSVGLLGFDFIAELGITIDYEHHVVTAAKFGEYVPPAIPQLRMLDIRLGTQTPFVTAQINGAVAERMTFDTGGGGTFLIFDYFARRHPEAIFDDHHGGDKSQPITFYGIGGEIDTRAYQIKDLRLAAIVFRDFVGYRVLSDKAYSSSEDGIIGIDFISFFNVLLDYPNGHIYLWPNSLGRRAMGLH